MKRQPNIGQRLAAARLKRGKAQAEVARQAGIAPSYLSRIETGKVQPTYRTLIRVASGIGLEFDELAAFDPEVHHHGTRCPITEHGDCLLDLVRAEGEWARERHKDSYTVRQIELMRRFAAWVRDIPPDRLQAMEVLMEELARARGIEES